MDCGDGILCLLGLGVGEWGWGGWGHKLWPWLGSEKIFLGGGGSPTYDCTRFLIHMCCNAAFVKIKRLYLLPIFRQIEGTRLEYVFHPDPVTFPGNFSRFQIRASHFSYAYADSVSDINSVNVREFPCNNLHIPLVLCGTLTVDW